MDKERLDTVLTLVGCSAMKSLGKDEGDTKFRACFLCIIGVQHQRDLDTGTGMALGYTYYVSISNRFCHQQLHTYSFI